MDEMMRSALFAAEHGDVPELDVHGALAREIPHLVDAFLQHGYFTGSESMRILHGKGEGALRDAVCETLRGHDFVRDFLVSPDGGKTALVLFRI